MLAPLAEAHQSKRGDPGVVAPARCAEAKVPSSAIVHASEKGTELWGLARRVCAALEERSRRHQGPLPHEKCA